MRRFRTAAVLIAAILYIVLPTDAVPDFIPLVGWVDDLLVLAGGLYFLWKQLRGGPPPRPPEPRDLPPPD